MSEYPLVSVEIIKIKINLFANGTYLKRTIAHIIWTSLSYFKQQISQRKIHTLQR